MSGKYLHNRKKKKQTPAVVIALIAVALVAIFMGIVVLLEKSGGACDHENRQLHRPLCGGRQRRGGFRSSDGGTGEYL